MERKIITEWNLDALQTDFVKEREEMTVAITAFVDRYKKDKGFLEDALALKEALDAYNALDTVFLGGGNEGYYYGLLSYLKQDDSEIRAKVNQIHDFTIKIGNELTFFDIDLAGIVPEKQKEFLADPLLADYHHLLERLFIGAKYILSEKEEKIMTLKSKSSSSSWVEMMNKFLSKEERIVKNVKGAEVTMSFSALQGLLDHSDKQVRADAYQALNDIFAKHSDVAEAELNAVFQDKKVNDEIRGFTYPQESRIFGDNMTKEVVDNLVSSVTNHFDIAKKFYALKAELFGVEKIKYYDRSLAYGEENKEYSFEEGVVLVREVLGNLHPEFLKIFDMFIAQGTYDVYPKKGKYSGAFCIHMLSSQPTYILLNFTNKLNDVRTLAHETGHGINYELTKQKQKALNFSFYTSTAEVASTFMEDFVLEKLLKDANDELRLSIMMQGLGSNIATIFRQVAIYNFEVDLHALFKEKGYMTKEEIGELFKKNMSAYMGDSVEQTEGSDLWWIYITHIRRFFYVYTYASGLLISKALQHKVREDHTFINEIVSFLSAGTSKSPYTLFTDMGIDIASENFWNTGISEIEAQLEETIKLARKMGKIS